MALMDQAPVAELQKDIVTDEQYVLTRTVRDGWKNTTSEESLIDGYQTLSDILDWLETDPKPSQQTFMEDLQDSGFTAFSEETKKQLDGPYYRYFTDDGQYWDDEDGTVTALFDSNWKKGEVADEDDLEEMDKMTFHTKPLELTVENVLAYARYVFDDQSLKLVPAKEHLAETMQEYGYGEEDGTLTYRCSFTPHHESSCPRRSVPHRPGSRPVGLGSGRRRRRTHLAPLPRHLHRRRSALRRRRVPAGRPRTDVGLPKPAHRHLPADHQQPAQPGSTGCC